MIVGVCGGSGSGKSTLSSALASRLGECVVLSLDDFYMDFSSLDFEARSKIDFDDPSSIDFASLLCVLDDIKSKRPGDDFECPQYDFATHTRRPTTKKLVLTTHVVLEGIMLFSRPDLVSRLDLKIFVDVDHDVRLLRRIKRDVAERGRSIEQVETQFLATVRAGHRLHVEPYKSQADLVVGEEITTVALDVLTTYLDATRLESKKRNKTQAA